MIIHLQNWQRFENFGNTSIGEIWKNYAVSDTANEELVLLFGRQFGNTYWNVHIPGEPAISL